MYKLNGNANIAEYGASTRFQPGVSGNPNGRAKGTKNFSTRIRDMVENDKAVVKLESGKYIKNPGRIVVEAMTIKASRGDVAAATWLAKYGYGDKTDITTNGESVNPTTLQVSASMATDFAAWLSDKTKVTPEVIEADVTDMPVSHNVGEQKPPQ